MLRSPSASTTRKKWACVRAFYSFSTARVETVIKRLCRAAEPVVDSLCEEFANCRFTPVKFELNISDETPDTPSPIRISTPDTDVVIVGQIDRVDSYAVDDKLYVRVVDYKTGGKDFSPENIKEGKNLQMFLYLNKPLYIIWMDNPVINTAF